MAHGAAGVNIENLTVRHLVDIKIIHSFFGFSNIYWIYYKSDAAHSDSVSTLGKLVHIVIKHSRRGNE